MNVYLIITPLSTTKEISWHYTFSHKQTALINLLITGYSKIKKLVDNKISMLFLMSCSKLLNLPMAVLLVFQGRHCLANVLVQVQRSFTLMHSRRTQLTGKLQIMEKREKPGLAIVFILYRRFDIASPFSVTILQTAKYIYLTIAHKTP